MAILTKLTYVQHVTSGTVRRIVKHNAHILVNSGKWRYCSKATWKAYQRQTKK